jgi:hypothetical protein
MMANKIKYTGKLIGGRYFLYDELGMYWDLALLFRQAGEDEAGFNKRIDAKNDELKTYSKYQAGWFASIGLVRSQVENLPDVWRNRFMQKTHLFLYDPVHNGEKMPVVNGFEADFVWIDDNLVYTWLSGDNMNYRFRLVSKAEVDKWLANQNGEPANEEPNNPQNSGGTIFHIECPHCGKRIF